MKVCTIRIYKASQRKGDLKNLGFVQDSQGAHDVYVLKSFLKTSPGRLWYFVFDDRLWQIGEES